jgi:regulator of protease activity HflC (stomatin/prohibitin superfamily)
MKYTKITTYEVGLVFKNGEFIRTVTAGNHWIMPFEKLIKYDTTQSFIAPCNLNILLKDEKLAQLLNVVEVQENEIVFQFERGILRNVYEAGVYAFWKGIVEFNFVKADLRKIEITENIELGVLLSNQVLKFIRAYTVESYEKGLLFVNGKFEKTLDAGTYHWWKNNITIHVAKVDTRTLQMEISGQEILTKDKAGVRLNFQVQYKVTEIKVAILENKEYEKQLYTLMQLALREYVGTYTLDELLEKKDNISANIYNSVLEKATTLGVSILDGGIKDIILPGEMREIMNQVLIAEKKAQANIIMRREETASTRSLLNTAKLMEDNEMLFRLKEMEYVEKIAERINTISVSGGGQVFDQLKTLFGTEKKVKM